MIDSEILSNINFMHIFERNNKFIANIMTTINKATTVQRRVHILEQLNKDGQVNIADLSNELNVTEVTIRNDLTRLEQKKMLIRARGGAIKVDRVGTDFNISDKNKHRYEQKSFIGKAAVTLIEDGDTVIFDSGTTTSELTKQLGDKTITVITNSLNVINQLAESENATVIVPGGYLRKKSLSLVGGAAEDSLKNYFCDKLFLAVDGISADFGLSTPNVEEAHLNKVMISISQKVIVVTDSSKFNKRSLAFIANITDIDTIITDSGIPDDERIKLENAGIEVIIADPS
jgi:DeoR family transcriptional regulator of aga operon